VTREKVQVLYLTDLSEHILLLAWNVLYPWNFPITVKALDRLRYISQTGSKYVGCVIYTHTYMYIYIHIYIYIYTYIHTYIYIYTVYIHIYTYIYMCVYVCVKKEKKRKKKKRKGKKKRTPRIEDVAKITRQDYARSLWKFNGKRGTRPQRKRQR